ncbi:hypothetical protein D3C87_2129520 [compost metagenome]
MIDVQHQVFQRTGGGGYAEFGRKAIHHFHFGIARTHRAELGQHARYFGLVDVFEAFFLQRQNNLALRTEFFFFQ